MPRKGLVRKRKESNRATGAHFLETAKGGICQDTERNRPSDVHSLPGDDRGRTCQDTKRNKSSDAHSLPGDGRGRDLSGHWKKLTE